MNRRRTLASALIAAASLWCTLAMMLTPVSASAQTGAVDRQLDEARTLYSDGRFDAAVVTLRGAIAQLQELRDVQSRQVQLADAHLLLGLAHLAMRAEEEALTNFKQVVSLDPKRTLDTEIFSPRVVALFDRARAEVAEAARRINPSPAASGSDTKGDDEPALTTDSRQPVVPSLNAGTMMRLRLSGAGRYVQGNLVGVNDRTVTLVDSENQQNLTFPRDMVTRVDILGRRKGHALEGLLVGAGLGVLAGAVERPSCTADTPPEVECWTRAENISAYSFGLGLIGMLIGALWKTDEWVEVPQDRLSTTGKVAGGAAGIAITIASWD